MSCCDPVAGLESARKTQSAARQSLLAELSGSARRLAGGGVNVQIAAPAMHCGNCVATLEKGLAELAGVDAVRANLSLKQVSVTLEAQDAALPDVLDRMDQLGFPPQSPGEVARQSRDPIFNRLIRSLAVAGFAAANVMLLSVPVWTGADGASEKLFHYISALIAVPAVAYAGQPFFSSALRALRQRRVNMDVPISLGVLLATGMSLYESFLGGGQAYFDAAVSLLFFLLIGRVLDHMMRNKARAAASQLAQLAAKGGMAVQPDGSMTYLPLAAIKPGMTLRVTAGERFCVDGLVAEGTSDVDRALVTGESAPVAIRPGMPVEAGTLNLTGSIDITATRPADQSFLAEITQMMAAAEHGRSAYLRLSDRMARAYAPVVHILALATFGGWLLATHGNIHAALTAAVSVLIITCPCALGLAVPVAHVVAAGRLFANGVLMKDGSALERLAAIDFAAFDKTGTLTTGTPAITKLAFPPGEASAVAKALAQRSLHPAAKALAAALRDSEAALISDLREVPGHGVEGNVQGRRARLGRRSWVAEIAGLPGDGGPETVVAFAIAGGPVHGAKLSERLRPGAAGTVAAFAKAGIPAAILSGDGQQPVTTVAAACGIAEVHAGLRPGDKLQLMQDWAKAGKHVLMVGDGINDAPSLAAAHASMAPASASDVGRMAADFVFTRDDLWPVHFAFRAARETAKIVKQNFGLAIAYNLFAVPLAMAGQLNPLIAAVAMSTSSIIVVANSLRLQLLKPEQVAPQRPAAEPEMVLA